MFCDNVQSAYDGPAKSLKAPSSQYVDPVIAELKWAALRTMDVHLWSTRSQGAEMLHWRASANNEAAVHMPMNPTRYRNPSSWRALIVSLAWNKTTLILLVPSANTRRRKAV